MTGLLASVRDAGSALPETVVLTRSDAAPAAEAVARADEPELSVEEEAGRARAAAILGAGKGRVRRLALVAAAC
ncbi:hypothetical protein J8J27_33730, partial [Mycobacterium tuberculosis]|nr:hypothetical protein [Mycobacterium tuberculosis]